MTTESKLEPSDEPVEHQHHSEELHEIIAAPPHWIIQSGIGICLFIVIALAMISVFIKYPDTTKSSFIIRAEGVKEIIAANVHGQLTDVLISENSPVRRGRVLAYLKTDADLQQTLFLLDHLSAMRSNIFHGTEITDKFLKQINLEKLGEMQAGFEAFYLSYMNSRLLIKKKKIEQLTNFIHDINGFISQIQEWKSKYLFIAGSDGFVRGVAALKKDYIVAPGEVLFYITTTNQMLFGSTVIIQTDLAKIKIKQKVFAKLNQIPSQKFGIFQGEVQSISDFPSNDGSYTVTVSFQKIKGPSVNAAKLRIGMLGFVEITSDNISLFQRLKNNFFMRIN